MASPQKAKDPPFFARDENVAGTSKSDIPLMKKIIILKNEESEQAERFQSWRTT